MAGISGPAVFPADGAFVASFEEQRRQRLLRLLIPLGLALLLIAILGGLVAMVRHEELPGMRLSVTISTLLALCLGAAWLLMRRGRIGLATSVFVGGAVTGVLAIVLIIGLAAPFTLLSLTQLGCLSIVVVLAGAVGGPRTILLAVGGESLVTIGILAVAPAAGVLVGATGQIRATLAITILTYHWGSAGLMIALVRTLRQSVATLGRTTNELERARQVDALKDQFITQVNHELRTPVMSLQGYVDLLAELDGTLDPASRRRMLGRARHAGETLIRFVNEVLDTGRIDHDAVVTPAVVLVRPVVYDALSLIDPREALVGGRTMAVDVPADLAIWGDATRLRQILANLIANAVKYSPAGAPVEVTTRRAGDRVALTVRDYGLGVPPDQAGVLFHRFVRLPRDLRSAVRGTGVGLYLCRVYAEAMGGAITVESAGIAGQGSRFTVWLPAPPADVVAPTQTPTRKMVRAR